MRRPSFLSLPSLGTGVALALAAAAPLRAQTAGVVTDLMKDVSQVEQTMVALA